jgi:hypothetical protein
MIIGICGFQSAGKDTLGDYLVNKLFFVKLSFASLLKDIISILFSWDREKLEGLTPENRQWRETIDEWWATKLNIPNLTPRYVMQFFGTELFRTHWHKDFWIIALERKITEEYKGQNIVITDCRFPNEIELIKKYNGMLIRIDRDLPRENTNSNRHESETAWINSEFDHVILNNGTKEDLYRKFISLLNVNK